MNGNELRDQLFAALRGRVEPDDPQELNLLALHDLDRIMPIIDRYIAWRQFVWEETLIQALDK